MPFLYWTAVAVLATLPLTVAAQEQNPPSGPDAPNAKVPALVYQSAFRHYRPAADEEGPPDKIWRTANEEMQRLGGHTGHLKDASKTRPGEAPAGGMPQHGKGH